ncbi:hypothetical protein [Pseudomonas typographi]|uniref:Ubiquitin-activating enzyme E1 FCCH domain-containing protein n=1 Tax=Pseudomonas typographi TaxID=2715964 RepID=A0ABR7Z9L8_9PSED|nr:hypothetical protein [Pseudomonas typographi]MBD1601988.1 hypothetical protein [Pseudomonas typographi]
MADLIQPSFSAGEMSPATFARVDLARYYTGLRTCRNFVVLPEGGVQNRAGLEFTAEVKDSSVFTRLVPFQYSTQQTYVLEFGNQYIRFVSEGGQVTSGGTVYEIASPYTTADLSALQFTQSADVLTLVHPSYAPRELKRLGATNWTLTEISFEPDISAPSGLTAAARSGGSDATSNYEYRITAVSSFASGSVESWPSNTATVDSWDSLPGATLSWTAVSGADHYNVYKNKSSGVFGYIGKATTNAFTDINITPDADKTVPVGYNPFDNANYPSTVGYFQQRMVFAASSSQPQTIWMSRTSDFHNFGYSDPSRDDDGIEITLASREVNQIRHLVSLRELLALTSGAEWSITAADESGVTPDSISAIPQSYVGTNSVIPAVYGNTALYVQARGGKLATLAYNYVADGFVAQDVSVLSSHLMRGYTLDDMAFTLAPNGVVWIVRNDGALLGFTFMADQQVYAWHRHDTDGVFESVASVPEGDEDVLYAIVKRTINGVTKRYIERMASRQLTKYGSGDYAYDRAFFVDCGLTYDGRQEGTATLTGGTDWKYPNPLTLTTSASVFTSAMVGRSVMLYGGGTDDTIGDVLVAKITAYSSATSVTVEPQTIVPDSLQGVSATRWGLAATTISGLGHLEGKTVSILADGDVMPQDVVSSGSITLDSPVLVAHIGLPITADFETLDITMQNNQAFLANKKRINGVTVLCQESRGLFAGSDADHLYEFKQRATENYGEPITLLTGRAEIPVSCDWNDAGRMFIRQSDPLPLTILGVIPNVQAGG